MYSGEGRELGNRSMVMRMVQCAKCEGLFLKGESGECGSVGGILRVKGLLVSERGQLRGCALDEIVGKCWQGF